MSKSKWSQFSLRTFILVTVVLGTCLAIYLSSSKPSLIELTADNFDKLALSSKRPVLVVFRADWCAPCREMYPILEEFVEEHHRRATVGTVDIDTQPQLAARFKVQGVPTILVIRSGKVVLEVAGILDIDELSELIFE